MLLSSVVPRTLLVAVILCIACDTCKDEDSVVAIPGATFCGYNASGGGEIVVYFQAGSPGELHMVQWTGREGGRTTGESKAVISEEAIEILEATAAYFEDGGELGPYVENCLTSIDAPVVAVTIPVGHSILGFRYPAACAPAPLLEVDGLCQELVAKMPSCDSSPYIEDCEVIQ